MVRGGQGQPDIAGIKSRAFQKPGCAAWFLGITVKI
jgi:hypothetical protein